MEKLKTDLQVTGSTRPQRIGKSGWGVHVPFRGTIELPAGDALSESFAKVEMTIDLVDGVLQPTTVCVTATDGTSITGTTLRQLPVRGMANHLIFTHIGDFSDDDGTTTFMYSGGVVRLDEGERERIRLQGPTDESLRVVANYYELGRTIGKNPAQFVEANLGLPRTTATKWIRRARDKGLIGGGVDRGKHSEEA